MGIGGRFELEQIVWAKVDGYPWWPGFIKSFSSKGKIEVMFFDDFTRAFVKEDKLADLGDSSLEHLKSRAIYRKAFEQLARIQSGESRVEDERKRVEVET